MQLSQLEKLFDRDSHLLELWLKAARSSLDVISVRW
jgi:hypothetical protein